MTPLEDARHLIAGPGISAESGVPTFLGPGGLWRNFRPEDLATFEAFAKDPQLVWEWYRWRRSLIAGVHPNPSRLALVELERRTPVFTLITQNADGLHDRAGSKNIRKIHGDIWLTRCALCSYQRVDTAAENEGVPRCPDCAAPLRPGVEVPLRQPVAQRRRQQQTLIQVVRSESLAVVISYG